MPLPAFQTLLLPVLRTIDDGTEHPVARIREHAAASFGLTPEDLSERMKNGTSLFANRIAWALSYLNKAQLIRLATRGVYRITERGTQFLKTNPPAITPRNLRQFPEFAVFYRRATTPQTGPQPASGEETETPEERLEESFQLLRDALAGELLQLLMNSSPARFEGIVVDLLLAMGYGGSAEDAGKVVGKSGDGGIDGVIKQDKLGLDVVYVQAKRWKDIVGSPEIMKFSGALTKRHAAKGVFITTSCFSKDALEYVEAIPQKIVLIDGARLASFMIDHNVGVVAARTYVTKRLDQDYFENL